MKELAEQAATGTYTSAQRSLMQSEFDEMRNEITRIAEATEFNGIKGLNASGSVTVHFGAGNSSAEDYYSVTKYDLDANGLSIDSLNIATQASAQAALTAIDSAISTKDTARAHFGAMINRLQNTITNLTIQRDNLQAAEAAISDVDVAEEMANLTKQQVLAQAGVAMLAQANAVPALALRLLG